jgi:hypothetical protein
LAKLVHEAKNNVTNCPRRAENWPQLHPPAYRKFQPMGTP